MDKLNETIKEIENCIGDNPYCTLCKYHEHIACKSFLLKNALELLKEIQGQNNKLDYLFSKIAGHSDYHGDSILTAITLIKEGKEIESVRPKDGDGE